MTGHRLMRCSIVVAGALLATAFAHPGAANTLEECAEAGAFIGNAARARDAGMSRDAFLTRMEADFQVIRAFPKELRWFAENEDDERFLLDAARDVFDRPAPPEEHKLRFVKACISRMYV